MAGWTDRLPHCSAIPIHLSLGAGGTRCVCSFLGSTGGTAPVAHRRQRRAPNPREWPWVANPTHNILARANLGESEGLGRGPRESSWCLGLGHGKGWPGLPSWFTASSMRTEDETGKGETLMACLKIQLGKAGGRRRRQRGRVANFDPCRLDGRLVSSNSRALLSLGCSEGEPC